MFSKEAVNTLKTYKNRNADHSDYGRQCAKNKTPAGASKPGRKAREHLARRRLAHSATLNSVKDQASAYKAPGSMNPRH